MRGQRQRIGTLRDVKVQTIVRFEQARTGIETPSDRAIGHDGEGFTISRLEAIDQGQRNLAVQCGRAGHVNLVIVVNACPRRGATELNVQRGGVSLRVRVHVQYAGRVARTNHARIEQRHIEGSATTQYFVAGNQQGAIHETLALPQGGCVKYGLINRELLQRGICRRRRQQAIDQRNRDRYRIAQCLQHRIGVR